MSETAPILGVIRAAVKAVPAVKWALGVGGLLAVVALIYVFRLDPRAAFVGLIILFVFMIVLVVFARIAASKTTETAGAAFIMTWFTIGMFMITTILLFSSVFFQRPLDLQGWLTGARIIADKALNDQDAIELPPPDDGTSNVVFDAPAGIDKPPTADAPLYIDTDWRPSIRAAKEFCRSRFYEAERKFTDLRFLLTTDCKQKEIISTKKSEYKCTCILWLVPKSDK